MRPSDMKRGGTGPGPAPEKAVRNQRIPKPGACSSIRITLALMTIKRFRHWTSFALREKRKPRMGIWLKIGTPDSALLSR